QLPQVLERCRRFHAFNYYLGLAHRQVSAVSRSDALPFMPENFVDQLRMEVGGAQLLPVHVAERVRRNVLAVQSNLVEIIIRPFAPACRFVSAFDQPSTVTRLLRRPL